MNFGSSGHTVRPFDVQIFTSKSSGHRISDVADSVFWKFILEVADARTSLL